MNIQKLASRISASWLVLCGVALVSGFLSISGSILWEMRGRALDARRETATSLVATIASHIERNIEIYDLSLQGVINALRQPDLRSISPEMRQLVLFDRATTAKDLGALLVLDQAGNVVYDSAALISSPESYSGSEFFRVHQTRTDVGLFISPPWVGKDGQYLISLSRRISKEDGSFGGVVVGSMRLSYFHDLFRKVHIGSADVLTLLSTDGLVLMRSPFDLEEIGRRISKNAIILRKDANKDAGSFRSVSVVDGTERLFVYERIAGHPLILVMGVSIDAVFRDWWHQVTLIGPILAGLCILTLALIAGLSGALKRRKLAETRLAVLASTDGLTGLPNRRHFNEALEQEWRRATRSEARLALVMIDVDHFKSYNDTFGHQAGDAALQAIANCIFAAARRAQDVCARYGGEEFAVLLPDVDLEGALQVCENIRDNVLALRSRGGLRGGASPTISLGLAIMIPHVGVTPSDLIRSADLALYAAKRGGRNRTIIAGEFSLESTTGASCLNMPQTLIAVDAE